MKRSLSKSRSKNHVSSSKPASRGWRRWPLLAVGACLAFICLGGILIVGTVAAPQSEATTAAEQTATASDPPGTIDGAKNPELIPDQVALRMIVLAVAEPADATEAQKARALAKLRPIELSEEDTIAFLSLLADFHSQAKALDEQIEQIRVRAPIPHPDSTDYEQLVELGSRKNKLVNDTVAAIPARLSAEGLQKLAAFLPEAKKGIKIIPD